MLDKAKNVHYISLMIRDEDVIKSGTSKYMKPHEKVLYTLALIFGILLAIAGIVMLAIGIGRDGDGLLLAGIILLVVGILEVIGVGLLLWTEGVKKSRNS